MPHTEVQDFSCKYENHPCELREMQKKKKTFETWFKGLFLISERNFVAFWYLRSKGAVEMEIARQKATKYWYVMHPFSMLRLVWESLSTFLFVAAIVFIPFRCSFLNCFNARYYILVGRPLDDIYVGVYIQMALVTFSILDVFGNFITGFYDRNTGQIILSPIEIFKKYFFPHFFLDIFTSIPLDFIIIQFYGMEAYANGSPLTLFLLQLYSMVRMVRFRRYFVSWSRMTKIHRSWTQGFRLASSLLTFYLLFSWSVCLNIVIPEALLWDKLYDNKIHCWIESSNFLNMNLYNQFTTAIVNSFHSLLGLKTLWLPLFSTEDFFVAIFVMITSKIYGLYFLIIILEAISSSNALQVKIHLIRSQLEEYLKHKDYPVKIKQRMSRFYLYRFQARYLGNTAILGLLTKSLRKDISMYTCQRFLQKSELFQSVPKKKLLRFLQRMTKEMFFPKDVIIQGNTYGECMYFICSGTVMVSTVSGKEICTLKDGDFFGEIALIVQDKRRIATVTALTMTELYKLELSEFKKMTSMYPDVLTQLEKYAMERYRIIDMVEGRFDLTKRYGVD